MYKKFRLAVVGCGDIAGYVAMITKTIPQITISACASKTIKEAQLFAKKHHIPNVYTDYQSLLDHQTQFDAIYLSTPHHLHAPMIRAAVHLSIPILCEKPIAENLIVAKEIANDAITANVKIGINYQYRYDHSCQKLIAYAHQDIGKVHYVRINVPWHRELNYFNQSEWHKKVSSAGGGTLLTQGSHFLDIALQAVNSAPYPCVWDNSKQNLQGYRGRRLCTWSDYNAKWNSYRNLLVDGGKPRTKCDDRNLWRKWDWHFFC